MSEQYPEHTNQNPAEHEPFMLVNINGEQNELYRRNTALYTFLGRAAMNHVFYEKSRNEETGHTTGAWFFQQIMPEQYGLMEGYMRQNQYPIYDNMLEVPEMDIDALERQLKRDIDEIPDWLKEAGE